MKVWRKITHEFQPDISCGAVSTLLNPSYREREVHHQLEVSDAVFLVSDGVCIDGMNFTGLPKLRRTYTTRTGTTR